MDWTTMSAAIPPLKGEGRVAVGDRGGVASNDTTAIVPHPARASHESTLPRFALEG
jgi:hypothetical protein